MPKKNFLLLLTLIVASAIPALATDPPPVSVPEPSSLALLGAGIVGLVLNLKRRK